LNSVCHFLHRVLKLHNISAVIAFGNSVDSAAHIDIRVQSHGQQLMQSFEEPPAADHNSGQLSQEIKANELDHRSTIIPICFHECTRVDVATCEILIEHAVGFSLLELGVDFDSRNTPELGVETSPVN